MLDPNLDRAVYVVACDGSWNPRTIVRQFVWHGETVHEELLVFATLREALTYARQAFGSTDGPAQAA